MNPILTVHQLTAGYPGLLVLREISLTLHRQEVCCVIGPNGSGKSSLLKVLAGQLKPLHGIVRLDGRDLQECTTSWIASRIARSPQIEVTDWPVSVREAVLLGRSARRGWFRPFSRFDYEIVDSCLLETGLGDFSDRLVTELSAGELQRVLIARALAQEPRVLLLDEPTSHLDLKHQHEILELAAKLATERDLSVIMVLHDLTLAATWCHRVVVLHQGRIVGDGPPRQVFTSDLLSEVYDIPVRILADQNDLFVVPLRSKT